MRERAQNLTPPDTENNPALCARVQSWLLLAAELLLLRMKYLRQPPWNFVRADSPEGASEFLRTATSSPMAEQDALTQFLYEKHRDALERCAHGDEPSPSLKAEVSIMEETPLDESAGEGYHRSTNITRLRASNARSPYLKQSTRTKQNIALMKRFLRLGPPGNLVIRYEWQKWTRVLQGRRRHYWWKKLLKTPQAFHRMYRMDKMAEEVWSSVCSPIKGAGQTPIPEEPMPKDQKQREALRTEYLCSVLKTHSNKFFSTTTPCASMDDEGNPIEREVTSFFQIVKVVTDKSRPHLMPTVQSRHETMARARLALNIQQVSVKIGPPVAADTVAVYTDSDPVWIDWKDLGDFRSVQRTLTRYNSVEASVDYRGCLELANPQRAVPQHALEDSRTPCLTLLAELYRRGWKPSEGRVVHVSAAISLMDGREAVKMKPYYRVLLAVERCFPLTSAIPSDEPLLFYKLLLDGVPVEPHLGNAAYLAIKAGDPPPEAPAIEDGGDGSDDSDEICVFGEVPAPKAPAKARPPPVPPELLPIEAGEDSESDLDPRGPLRAADAKAKTKAAAPKAKPPAPGPKAPVAPPPLAVRPPLPPPPGPLLPPGPPGEDDDELVVPPPAPPGPHLAAPPAVKAKGKGYGRGKGEERRKWKTAIGGSGEVFFKEFFDVSTGTTYPNWIFKCPHCPRRINCRRTCGLVAKNMRAGELEPLALLHVWRDTPAEPGKSHRNTPVDRDAVLAFLAAHGGELQDLTDSFASP